MVTTKKNVGTSMLAMACASLGASLMDPVTVQKVIVYGAVYGIAALAAYSFLIWLFAPPSVKS